MPISSAIFLNQYAEQQPLFMPAACSSSLMNWQSVDQMLQLMEPNEQSLQLFLNSQIPAAQYLDSTIEFGRQRQRINQYRFYAYMERGATLVVNQAEYYCLIAQQLCHAIGKFAQQPTSSNMYSNFYAGNQGNNTPNEKNTFGTHWDTHDVFAIQLIGKKHWQLFPPTLLLPLSHQTSKQLQPEPPPIPSHEYLLHEGDILYIPRGWWHRVTMMEADTLHLSVGTYIPTLADYFIWVLSKTLPNIPDARRGFFNPNELGATLEKVLASATQELLSHQNITGFMQQVQARERLTGNFHTAIARSNNRPTLVKNSHLSLTSIYPLNHIGLGIYVNGEQVQLNPVSRAILEKFMLSSELTWEQLCTQLNQFSAAVLEISVLDLARHQVININYHN